MAQAGRNAENMLGVWRKGSELAIPLGVLLILGIMILPISSTFLDLFLSISFMFAIMILLVSFFIQKPLDFSIFPSVLLVATLYRLSLNIATTRIVLLRGNEGSHAAGKLIETFGQFVVGGEYLVGIIVFVILVVINFVVITKGAGRIAEVAARFTLDAMPGKQMSIDADLNAGLIGEDEARKRRERISKEADFYGAMDGASKFVRGDAVAGIVITVINIVGGLAVGVLKKGMPIGEAAQTYTILTVGDGLVCQIPALFVSTAAGIVVTRAASDSDLGREFSSQLLSNPKVLGVVSFILFMMALVPGLPHVILLSLAVLMAVLAYRSQKKLPLVSEEEAKPEVEPEIPERIELIDPLALDVGYQLVHLVEASARGMLLQRIKAIRRQIANELGFLVPPIHIKDNLSIGPSEYVIYVKGNEVGRGEVHPNHFLAIDPGNAQKGLEGIQVREPVFGLPTLSIAEEDREKAQMMGYTVVDTPTVIATHLTEVIKTHAHEIITRQDIHTLLNNLAKEYPKVVEELVPNLLSLSAVHRVVQYLLKERVSIRDLLTIIETLADHASATKDPEILTEYARQALSRQITREYKNKDGTIKVITLNPDLEERVSKSVVATPQGSFAALEPREVRSFVDEVRRSMEEVARQGHLPVLLTSPEVRRHVRKILERFITSIPVLSYNEVTPDIRVIAVNQ